MPIYNITAPDGRTVRVFGDKMPTKDELPKIFAALPQQQAPQKEPSLFDKAMAFGAKNAESAAKYADIGASDLPLVGRAYDNFNAAMDASTDYLLDKIDPSLAPQKPDGTRATWKERFDRQLEKDRQNREALREADPVGTLVAGLTTGAGLPVGAAANTAGTVAKMGAAAKATMPLMAIDAGLRADGDLLQRAEASAKGAATAGVLAPAMVLGGVGLEKAGIKAVGSIEKALARKAMNTPVDKLGKSTRRVLKDMFGGEDRLNKVLAEAKSKNMTLAELNNDNINRSLQMAEMISPDARTFISNFKEDFDNKLSQRVEQKLDSVLKTDSGMNNITDMQAYYNAKAAPLYDQAYQTKIPSKYIMPADKKNADSFYNNALIKEAASKADANYARAFGGRSEVKVDDLAYWDGVKRVLDDNIEIAKRAGEKNVARNLNEARHELVNKLDDLSPVYKEARSVASNTPEIEKAETIAEKAFNANITPDKLKAEVGALTPAQRDAAKIGIRNKIFNLMDSKIDPSAGIGKLIPKQAQENLEVLLGKETANELIDFAKRIHGIKNALYAAKGGSQTGARMVLLDEANQAAKDVQSAKSLTAVANLGIRKALGSISKRVKNATGKELAEFILTNKTPTREIKQSKTMQGLLRALRGGAKTVQGAGEYLQTPTRSIGAITQALKNTK